MLLNDKLLLDNSPLISALTESPQVDPPLPSAECVGEENRNTEMAVLLRMLKEGSDKVDFVHNKSVEALVSECLSLSSPSLGANARINELRTSAAVRVHEALVRQAPDL